MNKQTITTQGEAKNARRIEISNALTEAKKLFYSLSGDNSLYGLNGLSLEAAQFLILAGYTLLHSIEDQSTPKDIANNGELKNALELLKENGADTIVKLLLSPETAAA